MTLTPGDTVDRYVIEEVLGQGGMGVVYRAHDPKLLRSVALKVLVPQGSALASDEEVVEAKERMLREARAAAALDHPNVVSIFDVGDVGGSPFIAMELVVGRSLRSFVGDPAVTLEQKTGWLLDVAKALEAAHARGLVHRDVKPENVMVRHDGTAKVLDFGIARRAHTHPENGDARALATITRAGVVIGTLFYMAPEQLAGEPLDGRADQFAWGVMAYELLSGKLPWGALDDGIAVIAAIASKEPAPLDEVAPSTPESVVSVVKRALAKDPASRFESMRAAAEALGGKPLSIAPTQPVDAASSLALAATRMAPHSEPPFAPTELARGESSFAPTEPVATMTPPKPGAWPRGPLLAGLAFAGALVVAAYWHGGRSTPVTPNAGPTASSSGAPSAASPVACREHAPLDSKVAEAVAAYQAGLQAYCDGNFSLMREAMLRAVDRDPSLGAPHLHLADLFFGWGQVERARKHVQSAQQLRGTMSPRDAEFLGALEPIVTRTPPDWRETIRRESEAIERSPRDARLLADRGFAHLSLGELDAARADEERAIAVDPHFAVPWAILADSYEREEKHERERDALDRCLAATPNSSMCAAKRLLGRVRDHECGGVSADAESLIAMSPDTTFGYRFRAASLAQNGASSEVIRGALAQLVERSDEKHREQARLEADTSVALWAGDFEAAEGLLRARAALATGSSLKQHSELAWTLARARLEAGKLDEAGSAAFDFLQKSNLLIVSAVDGGPHGDYTPGLLGIARRAGRLTPSEAAERRTAWLARWEPMLGDATEKRSAQIAAYLLPVATADDAADAIARLPDLLPLTPDWSNEGDAMLGKVQALAGHADESLVHLKRATTACLAFETPFELVHASLLLGRALGAKGDHEGACAAYALVVDRWGKAKPRSVTAEEAEREAKKLGCADRKAD